MKETCTVSLPNSRPAAAERLAEQALALTPEAHTRRRAHAAPKSC